MEDLVRYWGVVIGVALLLLGGLAAERNVEASASLANTKVCIDPGHGGRDPGAINEAYNLHESDINLDVAYGLKALLQRDGAAVVMTRLGDEYLSNSDRYIFCNAEAATILISVHTNSTSDATMDGAMGLYFHRDDKALAQAIYDVAYPALRDTAPDPAAFADYGLDRFASGVLLKSDMPAAMMEPLLMSHPGEAALLGTPIYTRPGSGSFSDQCLDYGCRRGQIAQALHQGVLSYLGAAGSPPVVTIASPSDGATFASGETITFSGSAADAEDGDLSAGLTWTSSIEGQIGTGDSFTAVLGDGTHAITAAVTDAAGNSSSATVTVSVGDGGSGGSITLAVTSYKERGTLMADLSWAGAASAHVDIFRDGSRVDTTANDGAYTDNTGQKGSGRATYRVCEVDSATCSNSVSVEW